jgi:1,4-dihydroxy-6-naphthoate synthase
MSSLSDKVVAVPGLLTTAFLALRLFAPDVKYEVVHFDHILEEVQKGKYEAGLLIHEGQLTYREMGLHKVVDLGEWWLERCRLPLPLGGKSSSAAWARLSWSRFLTTSPTHQYGLDIASDRLCHSVFTRSRSTEADQFISMYVNELTLTTEDGRRRASASIGSPRQTSFRKAPI